MRIQTLKKALDRNDIAAIVLRHDMAKKRILILKDYYAGRHDIMHKPARNNGAPNNKLTNNF